MPGDRNFDVVVVGGGLVSSAIAHGIRKQGLSVAQLDEGDVAFRAARGNFGLVWVQSKGDGMPAYARWTRCSSDLWPDFSREMADETGIDLHHSRPGGFHFCLSAEEFEARRRMMERLASVKDAGFVYEMIDRASLRSTFPLIGPSVVGASYCPFDGHANPLRLLRALRTAFLQRGGAFLPEHRVHDIAFRSGHFDLATTGGPVSAARVVLAAGNGTRALAPFVGLNVPVSPERGQILVTAKVAKFLDGPTAMLRQTDEGGVLLGDSKEDAGFDDRTTPAIMRMLAQRAVTTFPFLRTVKVVRAWGALRIMSPDGFPIYQQSPSCPGAFTACLHSGVTLAAAHAGPLAKAIVAGALPADFKAFTAERFDVQQAA